MLRVGDIQNLHKNQNECHWTLTIHNVQAFKCYNSNICSSCRRDEKKSRCHEARKASYVIIDINQFLNVWATPACHTCWLPDQLNQHDPEARLCFLFFLSQRPSGFPSHIVPLLLSMFALLSYKPTLQINSIKTVLNKNL